MTNVTADLIKKLRERTNVSMGKCKDALVRAEGDIEKAIEILRKEGVVSAAKKEGRETKEGTIAIAENNDVIALVEINAETDFVAQNDLFREFVEEVVQEALATKPKDVDSFLQHKTKEGITIDEMRASMVQRIGENIQIRRLHIINKAKDHSYGIYSHMGGKIVCIADIAGASGEEALGKDVAMHIAAEAPEYLNHAEVPASFKEKEEEIARSQVPGNKPPEIVNKIVEGKIRASLDQICLLTQKFVKDPSQSVEAYVASEGKKRNHTLHVASFIRWQIGA